MSRPLRINNPTMFGKDRLITIGCVQTDAPLVSFASLFLANRNLGLFFHVPSDIRVEWETYNAEESVKHGDAPSREQADGSNAVSISDYENIQGAPKRKDSPHSEGAHASARNVAVIMDKKHRKHFSTLNLAVSDCDDTNTLLGRRRKGDCYR